MRLQRGAFLLEVFLWPTRWTAAPPAPCDRVSTSGCFCPFENKPGVSLGYMHHRYLRASCLIKSPFGRIALALKLCVQGGPPFIHGH